MLVKFKSRIPLIPGESAFRVVSVQEKVSKKNNEMFEVAMQVTDSANNTKLIYEYFLADQDEKILKFFDAAGIKFEGDEAEIKALDFENKEGLCVTKIETSEKYGDQTRIHYFMSKNDAVTAPIVSDEPNDDIPF